ncbi:MAG: FAD-dependent monooxygenase [Pseudomonadota bacterium]
MSNAIETPVLIVGAGPVGLALSIELGWRGIRSTLIDQGDGSLEHPRTGLIAVRTMEMFRRWGFAENIRNCGFPNDYELSMVFCTSLNGFQLDKEFYPSMHDTPTPSETPEKKQRCPQLWMQPMLTEKALAQPNSKVIFKRRLESFEQDSGGVTAKVVDLDGNQTQTIRSKYLVGADGATSNVRKQLGVELQGRLLSYSINILITAPNLTAKHRMGEAERYLFVGPEGTWGNMTVVDGGEIWRLTVLGNQEKMDLSTFDAQAWVRRAMGDNNIEFEIHSVQPWARSEMLAEKFVSGCVILAGDSLHTMSPTGGMGMNTGMQEVLDLGWKLEGALCGWAGEKLIQSFEAERKPVAARNIGFSTFNFKSWLDTPDTSAVCEDTEQGASARAAVGRRLRDSTRVEWESLGLQIGHRYEDSPICVPDGTPPTPDEYSTYIQTSRPGSRAPHVWLKDGRSTLDLFGKGFTLLVLANGTEDAVAEFRNAFASRGVPLVVEIISDSAVACVYERKLVLVRPDGHVGWRGDEIKNARQVVDTLRGAN